MQRSVAMLQKQIEAETRRLEDMRVVSEEQETAYKAVQATIAQVSLVFLYL